MLRRLVSNGYFWLLVFSLALFIYHGLRPYDYVRMWPDSQDYLAMADMDVCDPKGLATTRTWGYPIILKLYRLVFDKVGPTYSWWVVYGDQDAQWLDDNGARQLVPGCWLIFSEVREPWAYLPTCQLLFHLFAVLVFYAGLRQLDFPAVAGVLMCLPVMFFDYIDTIVHTLLADSTGQSFLLLAISSFFFVLRRPTRPLRWASLALCVFAAYHIRAAFQFLLVMLPLVTAVLGSFASSAKLASPAAPRPGVRAKHRLVMTGVMLAICWLPYLAYCGWRYHVVGQFSLVAYTGFNFFGLCGQLFTEEMLPEVREECRPLAEALVRGRQDPAAQDALESWTRGMWPSCKLSGRHYAGHLPFQDWYHEHHRWVPPLPYGRPVSELDYDRIQDQYSWLVWWVMWPWLRDHYHGDIVEMDRAMLTFSLDFIRHHPDIYAMCVLKGWGRALEFLVLRLATLVPLVLFGVMLLLAGVVGLGKWWRVARGGRRQKIEGPLAFSCQPVLSGRERFKIFTWTVVAFFVFKTQLAAMVVAIMMVWDIDGRYADTASLMLPCLPMLGVYYLGRYVARTCFPPTANSNHPKQISASNTAVA
jgi:hypothetical protein